MSALAIFNFRGAQVRTSTDEAGNPWFVAADVCRVLDILNPSQAVGTLDEDEKLTLSNTEGQTGHGGAQSFLAINESGLYSLVLRSRKPEAKAFKKWITSEVLPAIRKTGGYSTARALPKNFGECLRMLASEVEATEALALENGELKTEVETLQPKAEMHDALMDTEGGVCMRAAAKIIGEKVGLGPIQLMRRLRADGVLYYDSDENNLPAQSHLNVGRFFVVASKPYERRGKQCTSPVTHVTAKGMKYLIDRYGKVKVEMTETKLPELPIPQHPMPTPGDHEISRDFYAVNSEALITMARGIKDPSGFYIAPAIGWPKRIYRKATK